MGRSWRAWTWQSQALYLRRQHYTIETYFWLPNPAFAAVEDDSILQGGLHQLDQTFVMLLKGLAIEANVFIDGYDSG